MIVLVDAKIIKTDREEIMIHKMRNIPLISTPITGDMTEEIEVNNELIEGQHFRLPTGETLIIGWDHEFGEAIGIALTVFRKQQKQINYHQNECIELQRKLLYIKTNKEIYKSFPWWKRVLIAGKNQTP